MPDVLGNPYRDRFSSHQDAHFICSSDLPLLIQFGSMDNFEVLQEVEREQGVGVVDSDMFGHFLNLT